MATVFIDEARLSAIGDAIREKTGDSALLKVAEMPAAIAAIVTGGGGGGDLPAEALVITGDCSNRFANGGWDWFIANYGTQVTTSDITAAENMFYYSEATSIPFDLNFKTSSTSHDFYWMFQRAEAESIGAIRGAKPIKTASMFEYCSRLRYLPEFIDCDFSYLHSLSTSDANMAAMFRGCYSLRSVPESLLKELYSNTTSTTRLAIVSMFQNCTNLDEVRGLYPPAVTLTSNQLNATIDGCGRLKEFIFATQADGTPYTRTWSNQTLDLSKCGHNHSGSSHFYNSGITTDKCVTSGKTWAALSTDPDWYTNTYRYSRYNRFSAVNTINSLPDCSAGSNNIVKFKNNSGIAGATMSNGYTDGGKGGMEHLSEAEIAVAAAKGWTVSLE